VKVTLLLADAAQAVSGKLYIIGGGWSVTGPQPAPFAIAIKIEVPWDRANLGHVAKLVLQDADGEPVVTDTPEGPQPIQVDLNFEVGRPAGLKPGTPIDFAMAVNFAPIPLEPDSRYEWRLFIDEATEADWHAAFTTRPLATATQGAA
jgi:hypothetical protein